MTIYHKLVRDKIPAMIEAEGKALQTRVLSDEEFIIELREKCHEELLEYLSSESEAEALEELADLLEVIYALAGAHGGSREQLEGLREKKAGEKGGFQEKILLIDVED